MLGDVVYCAACTLDAPPSVSPKCLRRKPRSCAGVFFHVVEREDLAQHPFQRCALSAQSGHGCLRRGDHRTLISERHSGRSFKILDRMAGR
jgi:hypothetical protein